MTPRRFFVLMIIGALLTIAIVAATSHREADAAAGSLYLKESSASYVYGWSKSGCHGRRYTIRPGKYRKGIRSVMSPRGILVVGDKDGNAWGMPAGYCGNIGRHLVGKTYR